MIITPNEAVAEAITTVFRRFSELGSARQVVVSLRTDELLLPRRSLRTGSRAANFTTMPQPPTAASRAAKWDDQNMPTSPYLARLRGQVGHELVMLPGVSACIFDEPGRVLLAHHVDSGIWALPGGAVEPDEDPAAAVAREAREELGIRWLPPVHAEAVRWWQERSVAAPGNPAQRRVRAGRRERS